MNCLQGGSWGIDSASKGDPVERIARFFPILLIAAAVLAYSNSFSNPFILDDYGIIIRNPNIAAPVDFTPYARMVADLSFRWNYAVSGTRHADYHLVNLFIHACAGLFVFGFLRRVFMSPRLAPSLGSAASVLAFLSALLWLVHPVQTGSVTYICQRYESLMGLFSMAAMYCFVRSLEGGKPTGWSISALFCCVLAIGTKEVAVVLPVLMLLCDYFFFARSCRELLRERWSRYLALFLSWGVLLVLVIGTQATQLAAGSSLSAQISSSSHIYLFTQAKVVVKYLIISVWPVGLCFDYGWQTVSGIREVLPQACFLGALGILTLVSVRKRWAAGYAGVWFFLILAPSSSILPLADVIFEHRMYLPVLAPVVLLVVGLYAVSRGAYGTRFCSLAVLPVAVLLAMATYSRNADYSSELRMWKDVVSRQPGNLRGWQNYAVALSESGRIDEAIGQYKGIISMIPLEVRKEIEAGRRMTYGSLRTGSYEYHYLRVYANLGLLTSLSGNGAEQALKYYVMALRVAPLMPDVRNKALYILKEKGVPEDKRDGELDRMISAPQAPE